MDNATWIAQESRVRYGPVLQLLQEPTTHAGAAQNGSLWWEPAVPPCAELAATEVAFVLGLRRSATRAARGYTRPVL